MNRIEIRNENKSNKFHFEFNSSNNYVINWNDFVDTTVEFDIKENIEINLLELGSNRSKNVKYHIARDARLKLTICSLEKAYDVEYSFVLDENATIDAAYADFDNGQKVCLFYFDLKGNYSSVNWHLASLSCKEDKKEFKVSFDHTATNTSAMMNNYGVCENDAHLTFSGVGHIYKNAKRTKTHQNAKIMVFDEKCNAKACPILCIDENDVEASHAATVGKVSDEHLFYLCSRGITETDAKRLITLGYLNPIIKYFDDEEISSLIGKTIEGRV